MDTVTQNLRDGQTNGLLIGPHTSNVLSEVILTCIDHALIREGYRTIRHIDDYQYYATTYSNAEEFIRYLAVHLREYELVLNERKTEIIPMPIPLEEDWVRELRLIERPTANILRFSAVQSFMDSALSISRRERNSAVLNYAIKMVPGRLSPWARRLFMQYVVNLAVLFPYLAPLLEKHVFNKHHYDGKEKLLEEFANRILSFGVKCIYPDAIAYGLHYAIKYHLSLKITQAVVDDILEIDDCLTLVLLRQYSICHNMSHVEAAIRARADRLKGGERRDKDRYWLLIYEIWSDQELRNEGQEFLSELKAKNMPFLRFS